MRIALRRENCNFYGVLKDKRGSAETTTGVHDCGHGYGRTCGRRRYLFMVRTYVQPSLEVLSGKIMETTTWYGAVAGKTSAEIGVIVLARFVVQQHSQFLSQNALVSSVQKW